MTLANIVTIVRIFFIPLVVFFLSQESYLFSLIFVLLFFLGDLLDGYLARTRNEITQLGQFLDPMADKLLAFSLMVAFAMIGQLSWWTVWLLFIPNLLLTLGSVVLFQKGKATVPARWSGKIAATVLALGLTLMYLQILFEWTLFANIFIYIGIGLAYWAVIDYIQIGMKQS